MFQKPYMLIINGYQDVSKSIKETSVQPLFGDGMEGGTKGLT